MIAVSELVVLVLNCAGRVKEALVQMLVGGVGPAVICTAG